MIAAAYSCPKPGCKGIVMATAVSGYPERDVCPKCGWEHRRRGSGAIEPTDEQLANRSGVEGGIPYDPEPAMHEWDPRL